MELTAEPPPLAPANLAVTPAPPPASRSRKPLLEVLQGSGVSEEEATRPAALQPAPGSTWTVEVLNSGKVDETRFATELGRAFETPVEVVDPQKIERSLLSLL